jgi:hypothetical protein
MSYPPKYSSDGYPLTRQGVRDLGKTKREAPQTMIPPKTDGSRDLDYKPPFKLMVSMNCGCTYSCAGMADDHDDFAEKARKLDQALLRWYVEDANGNMTHIGLIHRHLVELVDRLSRGNP